MRSGKVSAHHHLLQRVEHVERQAAGIALVDARRIGKAVADHPAPHAQRRPDGLVQVIGARGVEQQRLRQRRMRGHRGVQDQLAHLLGERRAAWLARQQHVDAALRATPSSSSLAWVDLPDPSPPSNVMNLPDAMPQAAPAPLKRRPQLRVANALRDPAGSQMQDEVKPAPHHPASSPRPRRSPAAPRWSPRWTW